MKTSELYEQAAVLIETRGLARNKFYGPGSPHTGCLCALGALCVALGLPPDWLGVGLSGETDADFESHRAVFVAAVDPLLSHLGLAVAADDLAGVVSCVGFQWSDKHTQEQVVSELRACAAELRAGGR